MFDMKMVYMVEIKQFLHKKTLFCVVLDFRRMKPRAYYISANVI